MLGGKVSRRRLGEETRQPLGLMPITHAGSGVAGSQGQREQAVASIATPMAVVRSEAPSRARGLSGAVRSNVRMVVKA